jgi:plasmid stabilization system protein ParE
VYAGRRWLPTIWRISSNTLARTILPRRVARTIYNGVAELPKFPHRGRIGLAENTRELVFSPWPDIVVYEILKHQVLVLRIRHAARDWP